MELKDTVDMMNSPDYKERFKAEYVQLAIRIEKLDSMLMRWDAGELDFEPTCSYDLLASQLHAMTAYLHILKMRGEIEGIDGFGKE